MKKEDCKLVSQLLTHGRHYAEKYLREAGHLPPAFFGITAKNLITLLPRKFEDAEDKAEFMLFVRLLGIAHELTAAALVAEVWSVEASADELPGTPPSESLNRKECVMVSCEIPGGTKQPVLFPIIRTDAGTFFDLGKPEFADPGSTRSRLSQFFPDRQPTKADREQARRLLQTMTATVKKHAARARRRL